MALAKLEDLRIERGAGECGMLSASGVEIEGRLKRRLLVVAGMLRWA